METVMKEAGSCGRFQIVQVVLICLSRFVYNWGAFAMIFGNYNPGWRCKDAIFELDSGSITIVNNNITRALPGYIDITTHPYWSSSGLELESQQSNNGTLGLPESEGSGNPFLIRVGKVNETGDVTINAYNGRCDVMEMCGSGIEFNPESSTIITEFSLVCDRQWIATTILTIVNAGLLLGAIFTGHVNGKFGRKTGLYGSTAILAVSSGAAIFSPNWQTYACFAFFMAFGAVGIVLSSYVLAVEFMNSKWRGFTASRPILSFSMCSLCIVMSVLKNWRHLHMATSFLAFLACCGYFLAEESPRWLFVHSQRDKAEKVIQKIARRNGRPPVSGETLESFVDSLENDRDEDSQTYSYADLFRSRKSSLMTLKFSVMVTLNAIIYRAISFGLKSIPGNFYDNAIASSFIQTGVLILVGPFSNCNGRRRTMFLYSLLGSTSCFVIVISLFVAEGYTQETIIKPFAYMAKAVAQAALAMTSLLAVECFPTAVRSVALSFNNSMSSIGCFAFAFVIPKDNDDVSFATSYAVMAACFLINIFISYSLPETNKSNLKDIIITEASRPDKASNGLSVHNKEDGKWIA